MDKRLDKCGSLEVVVSGGWEPLAQAEAGIYELIRTGKIEARGGLVVGMRPR